MSDLVTAQVIPLFGGNRWGPSDWKHIAGHQRAWRVEERGITESFNWSDVTQRMVARTDPTNKNATLAEEVFRSFHYFIEPIAKDTGVPVPILVATIANESGGNTMAERDEGYDVSFGLCQTLTTTAALVGRYYGWPRSDRPSVADQSWYMPTKAFNRGRSEEEHWRRFLGNPYVSITFGALTHLLMAKIRDTRLDPVLAYASYNAGGIYVGDNRFGLHATKAAVEAFVLFYNDFISSPSYRDR